MTQDIRAIKMTWPSDVYGVKSSFYLVNAKQWSSYCGYGGECLSLPCKRPVAVNCKITVSVRRPQVPDCPPHLLCGDQTALGWVLSSNGIRFCKIRLSPWLWTLHICYGSCLAFPGRFDSAVFFKRDTRNIFRLFWKKSSHLILRISKEGNRFNAFSIRFQPPKFEKQPFPGSRRCVTERIGHLGPGSDDVLFNSWMRGNELSELVWFCGLNVRPSPVNFRWLYTVNCCKLPVSARLTQVPNCPPVYCVGIKRLLSACGAQIR